ncbi:MAG: hypothetical protein JO035_00325 [Betaproteobacteria bacterium]|nr:hypothetical protein [Betaproteobacteria bacterium]
MITPRLLLIYNFGIAMLFVLTGIVSATAIEPLLNRQVVLPPFDNASQQAIREEKDLEHLRTRTLFYFELARDLKQARYSDTDTLFSDLRKICFAIALAFAVGGGLALAVVRKRKGD